MCETQVHVQVRLLIANKKFLLQFGTKYDAGVCTHFGLLTQCDMSIRGENKSHQQQYDEYLNFIFKIIITSKSIFLLLNRIQCNATFLFKFCWLLVTEED